jgi:hypothetical protein
VAKGIITLTTDGRGNYQRDIGWEVKPSGSLGQHRFYFGRDQTTARIRCLHTLACWDAVDRRWQRRKEKKEIRGVPAYPPQPESFRPLWDKLTLSIAKAVASGQTEFNLEPRDLVPDFCQGGENGGVRVAAPVWLGVLQEDFPMVRFIRVGEWDGTLENLYSREAELYRQVAEATKRLAEKISCENICTGKTLHEALDAFAGYLKSHYVTADGRTSEHGATCAKQIVIIREHTPDLSLEAFGQREIDEIIEHWRQRPLTKRGTPAARDTVKNFVKRIRQFVKWLHKNPEFPWRKPADYEVEAIRVPVSPSEKAKRFSSIQVQTYSIMELGLLWKYATPKERVYLLLGLNCGFGQRELGTLQQSEIFLDQPHGHYPITGSWLKKIRYKSDVYGEWQLWDETVQGVRWYLRQRPQTTESAFLVTRDGASVIRPTAGGNRAALIPNVWARLTDRIRKDFPEFRKLSFNKLRKTAGNLIRKVAGGEIAAVFLCHGQTVRSDDLAEVYTDRPFDKVFETLQTVRRELESVFTAEVVPFPDTRNKRNPHFSLAVRERIITLRMEGKQYKEIAETLEVSLATVQKYLTEAGLVKKRKRTARVGEGTITATDIDG